MASIPKGGRYKPNRATYRQILKSPGIQDMLTERAEPYTVGDVRVVETSDRNRCKTRVYANTKGTLGRIRTLPGRR